MIMFQFKDHKEVFLPKNAKSEGENWLFKPKISFFGHPGIKFQAIGLRMVPNLIFLSHTHVLGVQS